MAKITRRMAISSSHRILKEYQKKIVSVMADKDKVYLPLAGQQIVNRYKNDADGYKKLLDAAAESTDFFLGMQDDILVQYNNICNKLNKVFELNVADSKEIDGFVNEKYIIQSQKETVTGIRTVPLYSLVKYQLVNEAGEMPLASECSIEWEAEDIEHHFSKTINTLEAAGENVTDFFDNKFSNPFDRTFCSIKEGRYIIKAKIHDKNDEIIDVIEFEQIVETKDKDIESMDFVKKILLALQSVKWEKEPDYKALADALFFSAAVIIAINVIALIPVIGQGLAGAIVFAIMVKFRINCTLDVLKGIFKIAEALILIDRAKSRRAITVGGQKLQEGIQYLGNGLAGFILMKFTARNLAEARLQVLEKTPALPPPALPAGGASAVPATTGSALPALTATSQEVAVALNNSALMAMETVNQMSVTPAMKTEIADIAEKPLIPKSIDLTPYYEKCGEIVEDAYKKSSAKVEVNENGEFQKLLDYLEKDTLSKELQEQINDIPKGQRGDYRVPMPEKIKGIRIDKKSGQARIIEAWKPDTDGAKFGTREMCIIKKGTILDRIGSPNGNYLSPMKPDGTPYSLKERAIGDYLPEEKIEDNDSYHKYIATEDFTRETFEKAIKESGLSDTDKEQLIMKLDAYYEDCSSIKETFTHDGDPYSDGSPDNTNGVKSGIIDEMFIHETGNQDGGAIQYITPFSVFDLIDKLKILEEIK